jgi:hypothetical protein
MRARSHPPGVMGKIRHGELGVPVGSTGANPPVSFISYHRKKTETF